MRKACASLLLGVTLLGAAAPASARDRGADGRFDARSSSHFDLLQDADIDETSGFHGSRRFEERILGELEQSFVRLGDLLGLRPGRRIQVQVFDAGIFDANFAPYFRFPAAGFYAGVIRVRAGTQVDHALVRCLRHELVHAALDQVAPSLVLPGWLNEGLAEWFEARLDGWRGPDGPQIDYLQRAAGAGALFSLAALARPGFGRFGPDAAALAYTQSYAFVAWLISTRSERELPRFVDELVEDGDLARALRRVYKADLAELEQRFAAELSR
jgi:hypothetical protein